MHERFQGYVSLACGVCWPVQAAAPSELPARLSGSRWPVTAGLWSSYRPRGPITASALDRLDLRRPFLDVLDGLADRQRRAIPAREVRLAVLGINGVGDEPRLGAVERLRPRLLQEPRQRLVERLVERLEAHTGSRRHVDDEAALVERRAVIIGPGVDRDFLSL